MNGLQFRPQTPIYEDESALIPRVVSRSDFDIIFNKIYPVIDNYRWIISGTPMLQFPETWFTEAWYDKEHDIDRSPQLDEHESYIINTKNDFMLVKEGYISRYFKYIIDNWIYIYALPRSFIDLNGFIKSYLEFTTEKDRNHWLAQEVDICISNIDGIFWEFYSKDKDLLTILSNNTKGNADFKITNCSLLNKTY